MAYGHPFLDGNGRTIILVHSELCNRSGFSIDWIKADKEDYLNALTQELDQPATGILDRYLLQYKTDALDLDTLYEKIDAIKGLDGLDSKNRIEGDIDNPEVQKQYQNYKKQRGYTISDEDGSKFK